ncbi:NERD domain-containing protein [Pararhodobacter oceanensis]|uniref:NERD domain-containing protein n=1 Tax=Pararhodobacter oceanensis TaxID=2172121 RepID=UPI003A9539DB
MEPLLIFVPTAFVLVLLLVLRSPRLKGARGEMRVNAALSRFTRRGEARLLQDLTLPTPAGSTQIDHILITGGGVFVIETKNMSGWIFGGATQAQWTQVLYRRKQRFQNPIRQNYKHIKTVQELLLLPDGQIRGVVAFVGAARPKTRMPEDVVWSLRALCRLIEAQASDQLTGAEILAIEEKLQAASLEKGRDTRRAHIRHVKTHVKTNVKTHAKTHANSRASPQHRCPRCGAAMIERRRKSGGAAFLGCARFPKCRATKPLPPHP